jgi:8-oxo-dGTP diphosphatase
MLDRSDYLTWLEHADWIRVSARAIIPNPQHTHILVERNDWIDYAFFNFIGGGVEVGETLQACIARELAEETDAQIQSARYLFVVENFFPNEGKMMHSLEHYFLIHLNRANIAPRNDGVHFQWLPITDLAQTDLRPTIVRDAIADNTYRDTNHLILKRG